MKNGKKVIFIILILGILGAVYAKGVIDEHTEKKVGVTIFTGGEEKITITDENRKYVATGEDRERLLKIFQSDCLQVTDEKYKLGNVFELDFGNKHTGFLSKEQNIFYMDMVGYHIVDEEAYQKLKECISEFLLSS